MNPLKTLVVDDERLARRRILQQINGRRDIELVGECASGQEAVRAILEGSPDLVFLDVRLPDLDGFEVLRSLEALAPAKLPSVVFVTAFDDRAIQAFEVHALDYLLKPFDDARLDLAIERVRQQQDLRERASLHTRMRALLAGEPEPPPASAVPRRLVVRSGARTSFLPQEEILRVEADGCYVSLHTPTGSHLMRHTMAWLEQRLDPALFQRVHRSHIVALSSITGISHGPRGAITLRCRGEIEVQVSRRYRPALRRRLAF